MSTEMLSSLRERVTDFLTLESEIADGHDYARWLELWSPHGIYWIPCNLDDYDPATHVSIVYDDYERLQERCFRLSTQGAHSQDPPSRLCRVVGNVRFGGDGSSEDSPISVHANMVLVEMRSGVKTVYGARLEYQLVVAGDSFRMLRKKVILVDNDEPLGNLTFIL